MDVTAKTKDHPEVVSVSWNPPANLADATSQWGEDVVFNKLLAGIVIDLQSGLRRNIAKTPEELQAFADTFKPGIRTSGPRKSDLEKVTDAAEKMTPEQRRDLIKQLKALG